MMIDMRPDRVLHQACHAMERCSSQDTQSYLFRPHRYFPACAERGGWLDDKAAPLEVELPYVVKCICRCNSLPDFLQAATPKNAYVMSVAGLCDATLSGY